MPTTALYAEFALVLAERRSGQSYIQITGHSGNVFNKVVLAVVDEVRRKPQPIRICKGLADLKGALRRSGLHGQCVVAVGHCTGARLSSMSIASKKHENRFIKHVPYKC